MTGLRHRALLYADVAEQADVLAPLVAQALAAGRAVYAVLEDAPLAALAARVGPDRLRDGPVEVRSPAELYSDPVRALNDVVTLVRDRGPGVTVVGEASFGSPAMDTGAWAQAEAVLNAALAEQHATVVCAYHRTERPAGFVASAPLTHPEMYVDGTLRASEQHLDAAEFLTRHQPVPPPPPGSARVVPLESAADLRGLRRDVARVASAAGLADDRVADLVLAVGELATNSVEHGSGPRTVALWVDRTRITCEVDNTGPFDDPFRGFLAPAPEQPRGRGVHLARRLCDGVEVWADGCRVRVQARMELGRVPAR